ncbi:MAG: LPS export ABC transporter periplasmic protein LptC [Alphaproteobacteria bacterium]|nr:MAG: LPS export ABC transporter periplasmic protein LptC [Alphaproteobacteria bacterium]
MARPLKQKPASKTAGQKPARFEYTPRAQVLLGGSHYSEIVYWLKIVLPALAVAILLTITVWPNLIENENRFSLTTENVMEEAPQASLIVGPRYTGTTNNGLSYTIRAAAAAPSPENANAINLKDLKIDIQSQNNTTIFVSANKSTYWRNRHGMSTQGDIVIRTNSGYEIKSDVAYADFAQGILWSDSAISGRSPQGSFTASGFEAKDDGNQVILRGKVKVNLLPKGKIKPNTKTS